MKAQARDMLGYLYLERGDWEEARTAFADALRQRNVLAHILMFWPVPPLLGWHVFKTYWY